VPIGGWVGGCCAVDKPPGVLDDNVLRRAISTLLDFTSHVLSAATTLKAQVNALVGFRHLQVLATHRPISATPGW
jgi:hypothetical protein